MRCHPILTTLSCHGDILPTCPRKTQHSSFELFLEAKDQHQELDRNWASGGGWLYIEHSLEPIPPGARMQDNTCNNLSRQQKCNPSWVQWQDIEREADKAHQGQIFFLTDNIADKTWLSDISRARHVGGHEYKTKTRDTILHRSEQDDELWDWRPRPLRECLTR